MEDDSFAGHVEAALKRHAVEGHRIVFEITEQVAVRFAVETDERISMLRDLGCRIAIDDFGTGYSSFSYLKHLPVDYLKIDGSFIKGVTDNQVDQSMVRMVGEVARAARHRNRRRIRGDGSRVAHDRPVQHRLRPGVLHRTP